MTSPTPRSPTPRSQTPKGQRQSPLTVQGWQNLVLAIMGVVVLAAGLAGGLLLNRYDEVSGELVEQVQPSRSAAYRLQAALRDQETAVRGYLISADPDSLVPYHDGMRAEADAARVIRERAGGRAELLDDVDEIERAAAAWRGTFAEPVIAGVTPGRPTLEDAADADRGKAGFDGIRQLFDQQDQHLSALRAQALAKLADTRKWRNVVLSGIAVSLVVSVVALLIVMRVAVIRPLASLAAACRRITEGDFSEEIVPEGPKDIRAMAVSVDEMRQRIVAELTSARSAEARLDEQAVELRRSNSELEQFAYVASHDLQEPLRKVTSFCQLIEKRYNDKLDERGIEYIAYAVDGAKRMQVLINDLLAFSRVGRLNSSESEVDLDTTLDAALANLAAAIEESGAEIVRTDRLPHVIGDPTLLAMLWQNLIGNAMKFRREGQQPRIVIACELAVDGSHWVITMSDNGIGIAPEFVDKVFIIFQRLHGRDAYGGTGIGLAMCKKIVEHHGGMIRIDTSYTEGTRFRFTLPVLPSSTSHDRAVDILEGTFE